MQHLIDPTAADAPPSCCSHGYRVFPLARYPYMEISGRFPSRGWKLKWEVRGKKYPPF